MKHIISIFLLFSSQVALSQDLQFTINYIDSIYNANRTFFETGNHHSEDFAPGTGYTPTIYIGRDTTIASFDTRCKYLNRKYEKKVLNYLEKFMYDSLPNIRRITYDFIYSLGYYSKKKRIRQKSVNMLLEMIFSPYVDRGVLIKFNAEDFNKKAKESLKDVLRGKKTQDKIDFFVNYEMEYLKNKNKNFLKYDIELICKRDSLPYEFVRDSLYALKKQKQIKIAEVWIANRKLIRLAGKIYMYDFVPELKEMLNNKLYRDYYSDIKMALARMGDTIIEKQLLNSPGFYDFKYINTQRSLERVIAQFYTDETYDFMDGWATVPVSNDVHLRLQDWILNFPEELKIDEYPESFTKEDLEKVEKAKIWIKENKGNYKLNPDVW